jgi:2-polyprenyl-3-methyl-5-hydroxy-6-metoxy-1,4-benzoquinol methylase
MLKEVVDSVNRRGDTYHRIDLGSGGVIEGMYDMSKYLEHYELPGDLRGCSVLDVGTASGYFAIECAARGADVTAVDLDDDEVLTKLIPLVPDSIRFVRRDVYELDETLGRFDIVLCSFLLLHLPDPLGAMRRLRSVCAGRLIVATTVPGGSDERGQPLCEFVGDHTTDGDYWTYWSISAEALRRMCTVAGFARVSEPRHFTLVSERSLVGDEQARPYVVPSVVLSAYV